MIKAIIDVELEKKFRELAMRKYGFNKGALQRAIEEAIVMWVSREENHLTVQSQVPSSPVSSPVATPSPPSPATPVVPAPSVVQDAPSNTPGKPVETTVSVASPEPANTGPAIRSHKWYICNNPDCWGKKLGKPTF